MTRRAGRETCQEDPSVAWDGSRLRSGSARPRAVLGGAEGTSSDWQTWVWILALAFSTYQPPPRHGSSVVPNMPSAEWSPNRCPWGGCCTDATAWHRTGLTRMPSPPGGTEGGGRALTHSPWLTVLQRGWLRPWRTRARHRPSVVGACVRHLLYLLLAPQVPQNQPLFRASPLPSPPPSPAPACLPYLPPRPRGSVRAGEGTQVT